MMRFVLLFGAVTVLVCLPATAVGQITPLCWYEDVDSYDVGDGMHGQGGWEGWEGNPAWDAYVTDIQALSGTNSVDIVGDADLVHEFCGSSFGQWTFAAYQYIPDDFSGESYLILLNTYGAGVHNWSTQLRFDSTLGIVESEPDAVSLPLITGEWVEVCVVIDLDPAVDSQTIYYGGQELITKSWSAGLGNPGVLNIGAVDLFANGATSIYYDELSLCPWCLGDLDGDDDIDLSDLAGLLANYGMTSGACYDDGDLDFDGDVDLSDLATLLSVYGTTCE